jgi:hypothetical protein
VSVSRTFANLLDKPIQSTRVNIHPHDLAPPPHSLRALMKSKRCFPMARSTQPHIGGGKGNGFEPVRWVGEREWLRC